MLGLRYSLLGLAAWGKNNSNAFATLSLNVCSLKKKSLYICNINDLGIRPAFLLQHILVGCLNGWRCLAVWGPRHGECVGLVPSNGRMRLLFCAV